MRDSVSLCDSSHMFYVYLFVLSKPIHAYILQVVVLSNHMSGKDTHVRGMRILAPNE